MDHPVFLDRKSLASPYFILDIFVEFLLLLPAQHVLVVPPQHVGRQTHGGVLHIGETPLHVRSFWISDQLVELSFRFV